MSQRYFQGPLTSDLVPRGTQPCLVDPALPRVVSKLLYLSGAASLFESSIVLLSLLLIYYLGFDQEGCVTSWDD